MQKNETVLPESIVSSLDDMRDERRESMARIYAISAKRAPDIDPREMFSSSHDWQAVQHIEGAESRCLYNEGVSYLHIVRANEGGVMREHFHVNDHQYIQVLAGLVRARRATDVYTMHRGEWLWIPAGVPHRVSWAAGTQVLVNFIAADVTA